MLDGKLRMDPTEQIACSLLVSLGYQDIVYEPDGNIPPDFAVNRTIAVEVRRLNQNERGSDSPKGLEEVERPLLGKLKKFLESFGLAEATGWWVLIRFKRPVPRWERIEHDLRHFFLSLEDSSHIKKITKRIGNNFEIELLPKTPPIDYVFELGAIDDLDEGGFVINEVEHNLRLCIDEKTKKVARFRRRYSEWWLILVDHLAYGMSEDSRRMFRESVSIQHNWDRITVVSPLDPACYFDL